MNEICQQLCNELATELKQRQLKLATAESCTGGGLAYYLTDISGSSDWFDRGFVTYSNAPKQDQLGVRRMTLDAFGAVSEQTVREMAEGALHHSTADLSIAVTGIAGPSGGTSDKPVGTVWLGFAHRGRVTDTTVDIFSGNRQDIREQTMIDALKKMLAYVKQLPVEK